MDTRRTFLRNGLAVAASGCIAGQLLGQESSGETRRGGEDVVDTTKPLVVKATAGDSVWAMGIRVTVKVRADQTNGAYSVFEDLIPPGAGPPPHVHSREDETIYVLDGTLRAWLEGVQYDVSTGDFVHMPRGVEHHFKNISEKPTKLLLSYTPGGFEEWFKIVGKPITRDSRQPPALGKADIETAVRAAEEFGVKFNSKHP